MRFTVLVHRYAKALIDSAIKIDKVDNCLSDLKLVQMVMQQNKELRNLMNQPFVSKMHKKNIMEKLFASRIEKITLDFLQLMIEKNRESIIVNIYDKYYELYLEYKKIGVVIVTTAVELDEDTTARIVNILKHKIIRKDTIEIKNVVDKDIIGGFVVDYGDYQYDASVRNTLKRLRNIFDENLFVKGY